MRKILWLLFFAEIYFEKVIEVQLAMSWGNLSLIPKILKEIQLLFLMFFLDTTILSITSKFLII